MPSKYDSSRKRTQAFDRSKVPQRVSEDDTVDSGDRGQVVPVPMSADEARDASSKFCDAILNGHINKIRFLVRQYSATDLTRICTVTDAEGWSVMTLAADSGNDEILTLLIKANAPVDWPDANGWMPLHCAVHRGHEATVRCLISAPRMNVDYKSKHGWSALHIAVRKGFIGVIKLLVAHNADVNAKGPNDWTPLHHAAHDGRLDLVDALLAAGSSGKVKVNVVAQTDMGATPMFLAAQNCHREVVERFTAYSSTLTTRQKDGWAPIHVAASLGHVTILEALLANSAALVDYSSAEGLTSLHIAAQFGHSHVIDVLIKKGAKVNMEAASDKSTALHWACEQGHVKVVKQLLANNALIDAQNAQGDTSLMRAVVVANQAMLELLLDAPAGVKADPNLADNEGQTPLMLACKKNEQELALVLINKGRADVDAQDKNGMTCLHHVCRLGLVRLCQLLLQAGASISLTDTVGRTALHVVCQHGQRECLAALRTAAGKRFEVDVQTKNGFTPLYLAAQGGHLKVVDQLLQYGADYRVCEERRWLPIHAACAGGHDVIVALLVNMGVNINHMTVEHMTPLYMAACNGHVTIVQQLVKRGASVDVPVEGCWTALMAAAEKGAIHVAQLLLQHGADVRRMNDVDQTALHVAARWGHDDIAALLLEKGAEADCRDANGFTPLRMACRFGHVAVVDRLLACDIDLDVLFGDEGDTYIHTAASHGHSLVIERLLQTIGDGPAGRRAVNRTRSDGRTPLFCAVEQGHVEAAEVLLRAGADVTVALPTAQTVAHVAEQRADHALIHLLRHYSRH